VRKKAAQKPSKEWMMSVGYQRQDVNAYNQHQAASSGKRNSISDKRGSRRMIVVVLSYSS